MRVHTQEAGRQTDVSPGLLVGWKVVQDSLCTVPTNIAAKPVYSHTSNISMRIKDPFPYIHLLCCKCTNPYSDALNTMNIYSN